MELLPIALLVLCTWSTLVQATERISTQVYPCPHTGATRLAHAWSCAKFVQCVNGVAVERDCGEGLFFSVTHQYCTTPSSAGCEVEQRLCPQWTETDDLVYLGDARNCNQYFMCFDGQPLALSCAPGLGFDHSTNQCSSDTCSVIKKTQTSRNSQPKCMFSSSFLRPLQLLYPVLVPWPTECMQTMTIAVGIIIARTELSTLPSAVQGTSLMWPLPVALPLN